jgi:uncharacterized membrane protein
MLAVIPFVLAALWLRDAWPAGNLGEFFLQVLLLLLLYVPCAFALVLSSGERALVLNKLRRGPDSR